MVPFEPHRIVQELHFGPSDVRTFHAQRGARDPRTLVDRVRLRRFRPEAPQWTLDGGLFRFRVAGGAYGQGALWTRPVTLAAGQAPESAVVHFMERAAFLDGDGTRTVVAHVRDAPRVGPGDELAAETLTLSEPAQESVAWRGRFADVSALTARHRDVTRYVTLEIGASTTAPRLERADLQIRSLGLVLTWAFPTSRPAATPSRRLVPAAPAIPDAAPPPPVAAPR